MSQHWADVDQVGSTRPRLTFLDDGVSPSSASPEASSPLLSSVVRFLPRGLRSLGGAAADGGLTWLAILELLRAVEASSVDISVSLDMLIKLSIKQKVICAGSRATEGGTRGRNQEGWSQMSQFKPAWDPYTNRIIANFICLHHVSKLDR
jgi:hypothetical protein